MYNCSAHLSLIFQNITLNKYRNTHNLFISECQAKLYNNSKLPCYNHKWVRLAWLFFSLYCNYLLLWLNCSLFFCFTNAFCTIMQSSDKQSLSKTSKCHCSMLCSSTYNHSHHSTKNIKAW